MHLPISLPSEAGRPFDVVAAGGNSLDLVATVDRWPEPDSKRRVAAWTPLPGGSAATAAVAVARLGWRAQYIGRFGDDPFGRRGLGSLAADGVDVSRAIVVASARSRLAVILVAAASGGRTVLWDLDPRVRLGPDDVPDDAVASSRVLLVDDQDLDGVAAAAQRARRAGTPTIVDAEQVAPGILDLLKAAEVVICAQTFPSSLTGRADAGAALAAVQAETGAPVVCVTLGREGSLARCGGREFRTPPPSVEVVDTTGAGDAFRAGFVAGWLASGERAQIEDVLRYANTAAALNCRGVGARTALPTRQEVEACLR